jgi:hypothetical protein
MYWTDADELRRVSCVIIECPSYAGLPCGGGAPIRTTVSCRIPTAQMLPQTSEDQQFAAGYGSPTSGPAI